MRPFLDAGQRVFGENRVQEAQGKWPELRASYDGIELHLIGPLQTNKAQEAVALFDVIETVDRDKLAGVLRTEMDEGRPRAAGVHPGQYRRRAAEGGDRRRTRPWRSSRGAATSMGSTSTGLMCIPPDGVPPGPYFAHDGAAGEGCRRRRRSAWG